MSVLITLIPSLTSSIHPFMYRSGDTPTTFPFTKSPDDFSRVRPETNASKLYDNSMTITTIFDFIIIMAGSAIVGKMKRVLCSNLLPERAKCAYMYVTSGTKHRPQITGHKCRINYRSPGLSLRAGGRGFSPATKRVAPGYFYWKIEEK